MENTLGMVSQFLKHYGHVRSTDGFTYFIKQSTGSPSTGLIAWIADLVLAPRIIVTWNMYHFPSG